MTHRASAVEQVSSDEAERLHDPHESTLISQILQKISKLDLAEQERVQGYMRHKWRLNHKPNSLRNSFKAIELFLNFYTSLGKSRLEEIVRDAVTLKPEMKGEILALARKLKASPSDFVGQQIKLHCRFGGFENKFLDQANGPKFLSTYDIGFIAQSGKEINEPIFTHLFISKKEAKEQGAYHLGVNDLITVYGIVNSAYKNEPWIEVYVVG